MNNFTIKPIFLALLTMFFLSDFFSCAFAQDKINAGVVYEFYIDVQNQIAEPIKPMAKLPKIEYSQVNMSYYKDFRPLDMLSSSNTYTQKKKRFIAQKENIPKEYSISLNPDKIAAAAKLAPDPNELLKSALILRNKEKYSQALNILNQAIESDPALVEAYFLKGDILRLEGKLSESVTQYLMVVNLSPLYTDAYYNIAKIFESSGNIELALDYYRYAYSTNPCDFEIKNIILNYEKQNINQSS